MATIPLRPKEPGQRFLPAPGLVDEYDEMLKLARADLAAVGAADDDYTSQLLKPGVAAHDSVEACRVFLWQIADDADATYRALSVFADQSAADAASRVPTYGHGRASDYEEAVTSVKAAARRAVAKNAAAQALSKAEGKAGELAQAAKAALAAFDDKIASANDDWNGPSALRSGAPVTIDDLHRAVALEQEILATERPMKKYYEMFRRLVERGEKDKIDRLLGPLRKVALQTRDTPAPKLAGRYSRGGAPVQSGIIDGEKDLAWRLLQAIDDYRSQTVPASITAALACCDKVERVFMQIMGKPVSMMSGTERDKFFQSMTAGNANPWRVEPDWFRRYVPPSTLRLPGWSAIATITAAGAVARKREG